MSTTKHEILLARNASGFTATCACGHELGAHASLEVLAAAFDAHVRAATKPKVPKPSWADNLTTDEAGNPIASFTEFGVVFDYCWCPPGEYRMGGTKPVKFGDGFWMQRTPVTQAQWQAIEKANPSHFKGPKRPVESVSYWDCVAFCAHLSQKRGITITLPTEEQWEYACRAGTTGDTYGPLDEIAVYNCNETTDVGTKRPNAWGLYDTIGNVWEMTSTKV